jgi:hypothetical protein
MMPSGQLVAVTRPPLFPPGPRLLFCRHRGRPPAHARTPLSSPWRAHCLLPGAPLQLFRTPGRSSAAPALPGASASGGGEAQAAAAAVEFVTSERVKVAAMLALALALCNADRVVMSVAIVPLSQAYGWTPSFAGVVQVLSFTQFCSLRFGCTSDYDYSLLTFSLNCI